MKTNKSYSKRLKVTKSGKLMARTPGQNHFNARARRVKQLASRKSSNFIMKNKPKSHLMPAR